MTSLLRQDAQTLGFTQSSADLTGSFLRTLAASKAGGRFLELGTGVGTGSYWLLEGMDAASSLITVEQNAEQVEVAKRYLENDPRITFWVGDGLEFLHKPHEPFDFIFADALPGKIDYPELALDLVAPGGFYIVDDMELGWTDEHELEADLPDEILGVWHGQHTLMDLLATRNDFHCTRLDWSTGLMVCSKQGA